MERGPVTPVTLLAELAQRGATVSASDAGRVMVQADQGDHELSQACRRWKWVLVWGLHGAESGYQWFACDTCGCLNGLAKKPGGRCIATPGCSGHSKVIPQPRFAPGVPHRPKVESAVR